MGIFSWLTSFASSCVCLSAERKGTFRPALSVLCNLEHVGRLHKGTMASNTYFLSHAHVILRIHTGNQTFNQEEGDLPSPGQWLS